MIAAKEIIIRLGEEVSTANTEMDPYIVEQLDLYQGPFSEVLKKNVTISRRTGLPICQDTGFLEFFVFQGNEVTLEEPIIETLNSTIREIYKARPFRYSIVSDTLLRRENTYDNTPVVCHIFPVKGAKLEIRFLVKGGGSENLSRLFMMNPSSGVDDVVQIIVDSLKESAARGCPPLKVGIGIGGSSDKVMVLAKLALTRSFNEKHPDSEYAALEDRILAEINDLKIGYQGLGKGITAYSVHIETYPSHIAIMPVGLAVDCYIARKGRVVLED